MLYIVRMKKRDAKKFHDKIISALLEEQEARGYTNYKISKATGTSQSYLSYLKHGKVNPTLLSLIILTDALGISLADIIKKAEQNEQSNESKE